MALNIEIFKIVYDYVVALIVLIMLLNSCNLKVNIWSSIVLDVFICKVFMHVLLKSQGVGNVIIRGSFQKYVCFGLISPFEHVSFL